MPSETDLSRAEAEALGGRERVYTATLPGLFVRALD